MPLVANVFKSLKRFSNNSFYGALFDPNRLTLVFFKEGRAVCYAQEDIFLQGWGQNISETNLEALTNALELCISKCSEQEENKAQEIFWGVGGVGVVSNVVSVRQKKSESFKISKKFLLNLYEQMDQTSLNLALQNYYQNTGNDSPKLQKIFVETTDIKLDGQTFFNPIGQNAGTLEVEVFNAYALKNFVESLFRVSKIQKLELKSIVPAQYLIVKKLKEKMGSLFDATIINLYSNFTDISVVFGGKLVKTLSMPLGSLDIAKDLDLWIEGLEIALLNIGGIKTFSHMVYICGEVPENTEFWEMLEWKEWEEKVPFKTRPVFTKLDASYFDLPHEYKASVLTCGLLGLCKE